MFCSAKNKRTVLFSCVFVIICGLTVCLYQLSQFRLDHFKWVHLVIGLPSRDDRYVQPSSARRVDYDGWTPGSPYWLVDPTELRSKIQKKINAHGHHEILFYNGRTDGALDHDNKMLETCPYTNCHISADKDGFDDASGVIFELFHPPAGLPPARPRPSGQVWIFSEYENPIINGYWSHRHRSWDKKFNWSMSYRLDSDIIRFYGFLKTRRPDQIPKKDYNAVYRRKTKFAAWLVSRCKGSMVNGYRMEYINELKKYIPIDIYGGCGTGKIGYGPESTGRTLADYRFYLAFENSFCVDYVTEKYFFHLNTTDAVLVVRGGIDYDRFLPKYTFVNAQHFPTPKDLAAELLSLNRSEDEYIKYLKARDNYEVVDQNWPCDLCIKLNNKESYARVYDDIVSWWHIGMCWQPPDVKITWLTALQWAILVVFLTSCVTALYFVIKYRRAI